MLNLEKKPLVRALISFAVRTTASTAEAGIQAPKTHVELLHAGAVLTAAEITDTALLLLGRSSIASDASLPEDAPIIIGYSLLILLGITQALSKEGIALDAKEMTERLIEHHLAQCTAATDGDRSVRHQIITDAAQIPGQVVATAQGEVDELFRRCYAALPAYIQGTGETRKQLMPMFGTALLLLLRSQIKTDD